MTTTGKLSKGICYLGRPIKELTDVECRLALTRLAISYQDLWKSCIKIADIGFECIRDVLKS